MTCGDIERGYREGIFNDRHFFVKGDI